MGIPSPSDAAPMGGMIICRHAAFPAMPWLKTGDHVPQLAVPASGRPIRHRPPYPNGRDARAVSLGTTRWTKRSGRYARRQRDHASEKPDIWGGPDIWGRPDGGAGHVWGQINSPCARNPGWFSWPGHTGNAVRSAGSSGWGRCPSCARQKEGRGRRARQAGYESCGFVRAGRACQHGASQGPSCQGALFGQSCKKSGASRLMDKADKQPSVDY